MDIRRTLRGMEIAVTGVKTDFQLRCPKECGDERECPLRRLCRRSGASGAKLVMVSLEVSNRTGTPVTLPADGWELVDIPGYAAGGAAVCERLLPVDHVQADLWSISPGTRVRTMLAFPAGSGARELICSAGDDCVRFPVDALRRREHLKGDAVIRLKKRGKIRIIECWSAAGENAREYVFIGRKK